MKLPTQYLKPQLLQITLDKLMINSVILNIVRLVNALNR